MCSPKCCCSSSADRVPLKSKSIILNARLRLSSVRTYSMSIADTKNSKSTNNYLKN